MKNNTMTLAEYAVSRLAKLGITDCFGLPGDFAFPFDNAIASSKSIQWLGCANELNAAYAADGYARIMHISQEALIFDGVLTVSAKGGKK